MNFKRLETFARDLSNRNWFNYVLLSAITMIAAGLRFYRLGQWSFWIDEIYTINHAMQHFGNLELILENVPPARNWVPVSVILVAQALNAWGINEWSARLAAALIGTLSIPILFFPTRKLFGNRIALIASLLLAVSSWHIFWSQNARFYTSLVLFYSLALIAFQLAMERNKPAYLFVFYVFSYLAFSERLFAFFIFPVIAAYLLALIVFRFEKPLGLNFPNLLLLGLPIIGGGIIEAYSWIAYGESRFFADFSWFFLYRNDDPIRLLGNICFDIGIPLMVMALFSGFFLFRKKDRAGLLMVMNALAPLTILVAANPFIFTKDRYVFMILFSWVILAAVGVNELLTHAHGAAKWLTVGVLIMLLADAGNDNLLYYRVNNGNRGDWQTAFQIIQTKSQMDDVVVTYWPELGAFYLDREFVQYEDIDIPTLLNSGRTYWFVIDSETIWANPDVKALLEDHAQLIDIRYLRTPDDFFLRIYRFGPQQ